jgi:hypothetical protein
VLCPWIVEEPREWTYEVLREHSVAQAAQSWSSADEAERLALGVRRLLAEEYCKLSREMEQIESMS